MHLRPRSREEFSSALAAASSRGDRIEAVDLSALNVLVEHHPEDMTATVEAGMDLAEFQRLIGGHGQWLPIDPPNANKVSIRELLSYNLSGPRRFGYGTIRDYLIGIKVALGDGQIVKAGGKVVKNVAGYDLCKLFIGAKDTIGVIVEATFKLRPLPEAEQIMQAGFASLDEVERVRAGVFASQFEPVILDAHNLGSDGAQPFTIVLGFAGAREDVEQEVSVAKTFGFETTQEMESGFWDGEPPQKESVLPSKTTELLKRIAPAKFVARLGNGIVYYRGGPKPSAPELPMKLMQRVKAAYDPHNIFPDYVV